MEGFAFFNVASDTELLMLKSRGGEYIKELKETRPALGASDGLISLICGKRLQKIRPQMFFCEPGRYGGPVGF